MFKRIMSLMLAVVMIMSVAVIAASAAQVEVSAVRIANVVKVYGTEHTHGHLFYRKSIFLWCFTEIELP